MADRLPELIDDLERAHADGDVDTLQRTFWAVTDPLMRRGAVIPGTAYHHAGKSYWLVQRGDTLGLSICDDGFIPQVTPVDWFTQMSGRGLN